VRHLLPRQSESFFLRFSKRSTIAWAAALIGVAYLSRQVEFVLNAAFSLRGLTSGALLGGLGLAIVWRRGRALPILLGMWLSLLTMSAIQLLPGLPATRGLWQRLVGVEIYWPWYTLIGLVVTLATATLARQLLPREPASSESTSPANP
jgi:solute:Na+ symporter, SSS family